MPLTTLLPILLSLSLTTASLSTASPLPSLHINTTRPSHPICIDSPTWITPSFLGGDCYTAIEKLHNRKTDLWGPLPLEFLSYTTAPSPLSIWSQPTPEKHKYKSCTLAIVMLEDLPPGVVPAGGKRTDVASYETLERAAREIVVRCLSPVRDGGGGGGGEGGVGYVNPTGFDIVGSERSIGVFLWDTGSVVNQLVPRAPVDGNGTRRDGVS